MRLQPKQERPTTLATCAILSSLALRTMHLPYPLSQQLHAEPLFVHRLVRAHKNWHLMPEESLSSVLTLEGHGVHFEP